MSAEDRAEVLSAEGSLDVPVRCRNRLYAALGRMIRSDRVSNDFVQRWQTAQEGGANAKFEFLQTWAKDTTGAEVCLAERFSRESKEESKEGFEWYTKYDLYAAKNAYAHPLQMSFCDKLLAAAKSRVHCDPKHRKDKKQKHTFTSSENTTSSETSRETHSNSGDSNFA